MCPLGFMEDVRRRAVPCKKEESSVKTNIFFVLLSAKDLINEDVFFYLKHYFCLYKFVSLFPTACY